jgi:hypothetical protein
MGVNHRRAHLLMPQEFLYGADVLARRQQMGGERMAQGMTTHRFGNFGIPSGPLDGPLQDLLIQVMASLLAGIGVNRPLAGWEDLWPAPFPARVGVFPFQGVRRIHLAEAGPELLLMNFLHLLRYRCNGSISDSGSRVTQSLKPLPSRTVIWRIPKSKSLTRSRKTSIHRRPAPYNRLAISAFRPSSRTRIAFADSQNDRLALWFLRPRQIFEPGQLDSQHLTIQKQRCEKGLRLRRGGHVLLRCQMGQKRFDLWRGHGLRVAFSVESDEPLDPLDVDLLGSQAVGLPTDSIPSLIKESPRLVTPKGEAYKKFGR